MIVLGISGFEKSIPFKKAHWPNLDDREYRISQGHDSAAALFIDGELIAAAAEERFSRQKHTGDFPVNTISYCLAEGGVTLGDVDEIVHSFDFAPHRAVYSFDPVTAALYRDVYSREAVLAQVTRYLDGYPRDRVGYVDHHLAHAASAYFCSGWDDCLVVVVDGMGEVQSASVYHAHDGKLEKLREVSARDSIGILYSVVTLHLGFDFNADEYKIMGLAPYGNPARFRPFFEQTVELREDGTIRIPLLRLNRTRDECENYLATRRYLAEHLVKPRNPNEQITDEHRDVAAALQERLDRAMQHFCKHFGKSTGLGRLAVAGGVALNCKTTESGTFSDRKSTRLNSSHPSTSDAVFCLKKNKTPPPVSVSSERYFYPRPSPTRSYTLPLHDALPIYEHRDVAAALQERLDRAMQHFCKHFGKSTGLGRLAVAGGVALNCKTTESGTF